MKQTVTCETLGSLNEGAAGAIINAAIREAVHDLDDRGADDGKPREVVIKLKMLRMSNGQVDITVEACAKVPQRRTASTIARISKRREGVAQLQFQDMDSADPNQTTIDEHAREEE